MGVRVRYRRTELCDGTVEVLDVDHFEILDDSTVELYRREGDTLVLSGYIHPEQWCSVIVTVDA